MLITFLDPCQELCGSLLTFKTKQNKTRYYAEIKEVLKHPLQGRILAYNAFGSKIYYENAYLRLAELPKCSGKVRSTE